MNLAANLSGASIHVISTDVTFGYAGFKAASVQLEGSSVLRSTVAGTISNLAWLAGEIALPAGVVISKFTSDTNGVKRVTGTMTVSGISTMFEGAIEIAAGGVLALTATGVLNVRDEYSGNFTGLGSLQVAGSIMVYRPVFAFPKYFSSTQSTIQTYGIVTIQEAQINGLITLGYGSLSFIGNSQLAGNLQLSTQIDNHLSMTWSAGSFSFFAATFNNYGLLTVASSITFDGNFILGTCDPSASISIPLGLTVTLAASTSTAFACNTTGDGKLVAAGNAIFSSASLSYLYPIYSRPSSTKIYDD